MRKASFFILVFFPFAIAAQTDFGVWTGAKLRIYNKDRFNISLENQYRFDNYLRHLESVFVSPSVDFSLNKHIELSYAYRLSWESDGYNPVSFLSHRSAIDLKFKNIEEFVFDKTRWSFDFRMRGTSEYSTFDGFDSYLRFSPEISYNIKGSKLQPSFSMEFFFHFRDQIIYTLSDVNVVNRFNKARLKGGVRYPFTDHLDADFNLLFQHRYPYDKKELITEINFRYTL